MKNIKLSFFSTIIFANSMSGMEYLLLKQLVTLPGEIQNLLHTSENHHENLQQAQDSRQFSRENHHENLQQAKDNRQITKEEHEERQEIALNNRRVEGLNRLVHNSNVETQLLLNAQRRALIAQETKQKMDPLNIKIEAEISKAENTFRLCLVKNRDNFDLGSFGIPKICEDSAKVLRLLGYRSLVNELTEEFQK